MKKSSKDTYPSNFLNPKKEIYIHGGALPHWQQQDSIYFVTWRLGDALPQELLKRIRRENELLNSSGENTWILVELEKYLDFGSGSCVLKDSIIREKLIAGLHARNDVDYELHAYVIMPNHVHLVVELNDCKLDRIVGIWKGGSARQINRLLDRDGRLWQKGYWDRIIRSYEHWERCIRYILRNPERAGLRDLTYEIWMNEKFRNRISQFDG